MEADASPYIALAGTSMGDSLVELQIGGVFPMIKRGVTGIVLEEKIRKSYFIALMDSRTHQALFSMPEPFVSRRLMMAQPHFKTFTFHGVRYYGFWDRGRQGYYVSQ